MTGKVRCAMSTVLLLALVGCVTVDSRWQQATSADTVQAYRAFLLRHPNSDYAVKAQEKIDSLDWQQAKSRDIDAIEGYLRTHPESRHTAEARAKLETLEWYRAKNLNTVSAYEAFLRTYPNGRFSTKAQEKVQTCAEIIPSMPDSVPCRHGGGDAWRYDYTVTFTEVRGVSARVEWLKTEYRDRIGQVWSFGGGGRFRKTIPIRAQGSNTYSSWVRGTGRGAPFRGGIVIVSFWGLDENGHPFSGSVSSRLTSPKE